MLQAGCLQDAPPRELSKTAVPLLRHAASCIARLCPASPLLYALCSSKIFACTLLPYLVPIQNSAWQNLAPFSKPSPKAKPNKTKHPELTPIKPANQENSEKNLLQLQISDQICDFERRSNKKFYPAPGCHTPQLPPGTPQIELCWIVSPPLPPIRPWLRFFFTCPVQMGKIVTKRKVGAK